VFSGPGPWDIGTEAKFQHLVFDASGAALATEQGAATGGREYLGWLVAGAAALGLIAVGTFLVARRGQLFSGLLDFRTWGRITTHRDY
jgi:hypothetical protein